MITDELISYIKNQFKKGTEEDLIKQRLLNVGWILSDIEEGLLKVKEEEEEKRLEIKIDPYREITDEEEEQILLKKRKEIEANVKSKIEEDKDRVSVWTPVKIKPITDESFVSEEESPHVVMTASSFSQSKPEDSSGENISVENVEFNPKKNIDFSYEKSSSENNKKDKIVFDNFPKKIDESKDDTNLQKEDIIQEPKEKKHKTSLLMTIFFLFLLIVGGLVFVVMKGYIDISKFDFSFIKKDPKVLILNNSNKLASLDSYKTETLINITSPSFADISNSLISGEKVYSPDNDFVSINSSGMFSKREEAHIFENLITVRSSVLENPIITKIKSGNGSIFVSVPDLSEVLKDKAPVQNIIQIKESEKFLLSSVIEEEIGVFAKDIDLYKFLQGGISSYVTVDSVSKYQDFINEVSIVPKEKEIIRGIETLHYDINTSKDSSKKLIKEISDNFFSQNIPSEEKERMEKMFNSINIVSFEIWIGEDDNNIYQFKINLSIPLSRVLDFDDSSIDGLSVSIEWLTTYYDFNISNEIFLPQDFQSLDYFNKSFKNTKIKSDMSILSKLFKQFFDNTGSYGKISNKGNCVDPISGSLFSPTGHSQNSSIFVGDIASSVTDLLSRTENNGYCYSDSKSWAMSFPLESQFETYFCLDSSGFSDVVTEKLEKTKCSE